VKNHIQLKTRQLSKCTAALIRLTAAATASEVTAGAVEAADVGVDADAEEEGNAEDELGFGKR
jgi:hypothetical protein